MQCHPGVRRDPDPGDGLDSHVRGNATTLRTPYVGTFAIYLRTTEKLGKSLL